MSFPRLISQIIKNQSDLGLEDSEKELLLKNDDSPWTLILDYLLLNRSKDGDNIRDAVGQCISEVSEAIEGAAVRNLQRESTGLQHVAAKAVNAVFSHINTEHGVGATSTARLEEITEILRMNFGYTPV